MAGVVAGRADRPVGGHRRQVGVRSGQLAQERSHRAGRSGVHPFKHPACGLAGQEPRQRAAEQRLPADKPLGGPGREPAHGRDERLVRIGAGRRQHRDDGQQLVMGVGGMISAPQVAARDDRVFEPVELGLLDGIDRGDDKRQIRRHERARVPAAKRRKRPLPELRQAGGQRPAVDVPERQVAAAHRQIKRASGDQRHAAHRLAATVAKEFAGCPLARLRGNVGARHLRQRTARDVHVQRRVVLAGQPLVGDPLHADAEQRALTPAHEPGQIDRELGLGQRVADHGDRRRDRHPWGVQHLLPLPECDPAEDP